MFTLSPFVGTLLGNIVVALGIIIVVSLAKVLKQRYEKYLEYITAMTVGLLLGIIFLGFLPEITSESGLAGESIGLYFLFGILAFYLLELFLHWHHCKDLGHESHCHSGHEHEHESGALMFGGTMLHNAFHGVVLFSAFAIDAHFGWATMVAVLLHSIPQNIVNYVMNHKQSKYAYIAAFGGVFGALVTYPFADMLVLHKFAILAFIAGGLLYTALADIFPEFKGKGTTLKKLTYLVFIVIGILMFLGFESVSHHEEEHVEVEVLESSHL